MSSHMFKYTKHTLKKMEGLFLELEYSIRYERGNFQSGYCIVENRKIAVINKFFDEESRINCLLEILSTIEVDPKSLNEKSAEFYEKLVKVIEANGLDKKSTAEVISSEESTES